MVLRFSKPFQRKQGKNHFFFLILLRLHDFLVAALKSKAVSAWFGATNHIFQDLFKCKLIQRHGNVCISVRVVQAAQRLCPLLHCHLGPGGADGLLGTGFSLGATLLECENGDGAGPDGHVLNSQI